MAGHGVLVLGFLLLAECLITSRQDDSAKYKNMNHATTLRTITGSRARPHQFPYHVLIRLSNGTARSYCSAAIIDKRHVVSAAHCILGMRATEVLAGVANMAQPTDLVLRGIVRTELYTRTRGENVVNDIALFEVNEDFPIGYRGVHPVAIRKIRNQPWGDCVITGWARSARSKYLHLEIMEAPLWPNRICKYLHPAKKQDTICAGNAVSAANNCLADRSSILVCDGQLTGIANIDIPCHQPEFPESFTEVAYYKQWLYQSIHNDLESSGSGQGYRHFYDVDAED